MAFATKAGHGCSPTLQGDEQKTSLQWYIVAINIWQLVGLGSNLEVEHVQDFQFWHVAL